MGVPSTHASPRVHPADRGRRDVQLARRLGEAAGARRRLERPDAIEERELAHGSGNLTLSCDSAENYHRQ